LSVLSPHLEILPEAQRRLWPSLVGLARAGFVLYGGTAIALRYGHRMSVDFDLFSDRPLDRQHLSRELPWLRSAQVLQDQPETLTVLSPAPELENGVKVSFFGGLAIGRVSQRRNRSHTGSEQISRISSRSRSLPTPASPRP
jgi:hypothetical protein